LGEPGFAAGAGGAAAEALTRKRTAARRAGTAGRWEAALEAMPWWCIAGLRRESSMADAILPPQELAEYCE
jgi:hypothetical protein